MVKFYTLAFFIAAIGIFGMLDYAQQADKNGYPPLEYGASRYYHDRFDGIGTKWAEIRAAEALKDRQSVSASTHLPEAPEGWTRRDWAAFDKHLFFYAENKPLPIVAVQNKVFQKHGAFTDYAALFQAEQQRIEQEAKLNFMDKAMLPAQDKMLNRDVKIYYTANELIALRATYDRRFDKKKTHSELSMIVMANKMQMQSSLAPRHHSTIASRMTMSPPRSCTSRALKSPPGRRPLKVIPARGTVPSGILRVTQSRASSDRFDGQ